MARKRTFEPEPDTRTGGNGETEPADTDAAAEEFKVQDRRHWQLGEDVEAVEEAAPAEPSVVEAYRTRAESAEQKLQEYIEAFKGHQREQEAVRERLARDVDRKVELKFGQLVTELLSTVDDLDLSLAHTTDEPAVRPLAEGVALARDRFLKILLQHGVERISPDGEVFDPNVAEATRMDPVDSPDRDGTVTEVLQPGYRLGDRVIRAARVAVGRHVPGDS